MAKKISALTQITTIDRTQDKGVIVDVSDTSEAPTGTSKNFTPNQLTAPDLRTGTAILLDWDAFYGTIDAPESGDITLDTTGAIPGVSGLIYHEDTVEPNYPSEFILISGAYDTTVGVVNRIYYICVPGNKVEYAISQPQ